MLLSIFNKLFNKVLDNNHSFILKNSYELTDKLNNLNNVTGLSAYNSEDLTA